MTSLILFAGLFSQPAVDPLNLNDLDALGDRLRTRVAEVHIDVAPDPSQPLQEESRLVFGLPVAPDEVLVLAPALEDARGIRVEGPDGSTPANVLLKDLSRRVAILRTLAPVAKLGLSASSPLSKDQRELDDPVFALMATTPGAPAVSGVVTDPGLRPENGGYPATSLALRWGMPVFDAQLRWVGYARTVAWDPRANLLIPPEIVLEARKAAREQVQPEPTSKPNQRPWWGKDVEP